MCFSSFFSQQLHYDVVTMLKQSSTLKNLWAILFSASCSSLLFLFIYQLFTCYKIGNSQTWMTVAIRGYSCQCPTNKATITKSTLISSCQAHKKQRKRIAITKYTLQFDSTIRACIHNEEEEDEEKEKNNTSEKPIKHLKLPLPCKIMDKSQKTWKQQKNFECHLGMYIHK